MFIYKTVVLGKMQVTNKDANIVLSCTSVNKTRTDRSLACVNCHRITQGDKVMPQTGLFSP